MITTVSAPETVLEQLKWRYATKKFDADKKIPSDVWKVLEQSMVLAPSSFGLQPWKFFVVNNPGIRQQLLPHSWGQAQVVDASHLVVFAIKKDIDAEYVDRYVARMAEVQQVPVENLAKFAGVVKGFMEKPPYPLDLNEWSTRQVYIALGQFMTTAALLGIDTCPMEGFVPSKYDEVLGLPEQGYAAVVVCPAGYRSAEDKSAERPKIRFETQDVVQYID
ncbi:NAD(P)H-dependent oxidoreductase [Dulcicalothrix desertica PCC 7102]|uniref:NAD(P)H-dependent oxidoreductase n=1 Tax=Dulcicalothrix desertica PCC 7102 TaxID=232991 RepID=A0A433ULN5_9CYAN|nr:NAD(P)H-dependent oxidoreductase [Dulcicalothrix desertica]RUS94712.1 NAD(P)H-dependent oxidoreductase [Dulcicalothrix desertica PCC 7102]TWH51334.1 nitroreductase [Dulcicalothrix desertica PCC 7102]